MLIFAKSKIVFCPRSDQQRRAHVQRFCKAEPTKSIHRTLLCKLLEKFQICISKFVLCKAIFEKQKLHFQRNCVKNKVILILPLVHELLLKIQIA